MFLGKKFELEIQDHNYNFCVASVTASVTRFGEIWQNSSSLWANLKSLNKDMPTF